MPEAQPTRPEVVQAAFDALINMDPTKLAPLFGMGITLAEHRQAQELYLAALNASREHRSRRLQAYELLLGGRTYNSPPTWAQLFDVLSAADVERLRDLCDDLPDPARAEFDRRYGPPADR